MKRKRNSKLLWLNGIMLLLLSLLELAAGTFQMMIPQGTYAVMLFVSNAGSMILRYFSHEAIR
jgi:hypothetical protein